MSKLLASSLVRSAMTFVVAAMMSSLVIASPVGNSFTVQAQNFPGAFLPDGAMTFNAPGDLSAEVAPGSGGSLLVTEQYFAAAGVNGGDVLAFQFAFADTLPAPDPFAFLIGNLDIGMPSFQLLGAGIQFDFGVSQFPQTDITGLVTAFSLGGANFAFEAPIGWSDIFAASGPPAGAGPGAIVTTLFLEVREVPEPSVLALVLAGLFGFTRWMGRQRS